MRTAIILAIGAAACLATPPTTVLEEARNRQDRAALEQMFAAASAKAQQRADDAAALYEAAYSASYVAEVALELRDKAQAQRAAEAGIKFAERVVALRPTPEAYRLLGTLCGQVIPANVLAGLNYGKRAREAVNKAIELDPKYGRAYLARGVGNYYLPAGLGGGVDKAIADFRTALELEPGNSDGWLWLGIALRKQGQNKAAREAFTKGLQAAPARVWLKQQLEKTPAQ
jgi:tetratricopeptide (TPR) repeat protein